MTTQISKLILIATCGSLLAACGGAPASNELQFDNDGNGQFSGSAGSAWTAQEIRSYASTNLCGNGPVAQFNISVLPSAPGYKIFSGACAPGGNGLLASGVGQNNVVRLP